MYMVKPFCANYNGFARQGRVPFSLSVAHVAYKPIQFEYLATDSDSELLLSRMDVSEVACYFLSDYHK